MDRWYQNEADCSDLLQKTAARGHREGLFVVLRGDSVQDNVSPLESELLLSAQ